MYLFCPVLGATVEVRKYGWNKFATKKVKEKEREREREKEKKDVQPIYTISLSPVRHPHSLFRLRRQACKLFV